MPPDLPPSHPSIVHISLFPLCPRQLCRCVPATWLGNWVGLATNYHPDGFCNLDGSSLEGKVLLQCIPSLPWPQMHTSTSEPIINNQQLLNLNCQSTERIGARPLVKICKQYYLLVCTYSKSKWWTATQQSNLLSVWLSFCTRQLTSPCNLFPFQQNDYNCKCSRYKI